MKGFLKENIYRLKQNNTHFDFFAVCFHLWSYWWYFREFLIYLIYSDSSLIRSLNSIYFYSVMAPESYFHTVLFNSRLNILFLGSFNIARLPLSIKGTVYCLGVISNKLSFEEGLSWFTTVLLEPLSDQYCGRFSHFYI